MMMSKPAWLESRYELVEEIGSGGEAIVYRARDHFADRWVAIRLPRAGLLPLVTADPLPAWHPLWVGYLSSGRDAEDGRRFQVLELILGKSLATRLSLGAFTRVAWRKYLTDALVALAALHATGWAHGDLNAGSFIQASDSSAWRLLDLPFLRQPHPEPFYPYFGRIETIAPERWNGAPPNAVSDLYALGCLAYAAATGRYPHSGATRAAVVFQHLHGSPPPLSECTGTISPEEAAWTMRLLARDPAERFPSSDAAATAFRTVA